MPTTTGQPEAQPVELPNLWPGSRVLIAGNERVIADRDYRILARCPHCRRNGLDCGRYYLAGFACAIVRGCQATVIELAPSL